MNKSKSVDLNRSKKNEANTNKFMSNGKEIS